MKVNHSKLGDCIQDKCFIFYSKSTKTIKRKTIELMFEKLYADDDEDVVKVALVYLVLHALLSNAKNFGVPDVVFYLANDLNAFNDYPWGYLV